MCRQCNGNRETSCLHSSNRSKEEVETHTIGGYAGSRNRARVYKVTMGRTCLDLFHAEIAFYENMYVFHEFDCWAYPRLDSLINTNSKNLFLPSPIPTFDMQTILPKNTHIPKPHVY